jgi:hypothetical protein
MFLIENLYKTLKETVITKPNCENPFDEKL